MLIHVKLLAVAASLGMVASASAAGQVVPSYTQGESFSVALDPSRANNLVGGGLLRVSGGSEGIEYDDSYWIGQTTSFPSRIGGGEGGGIVYATTQASVPRTSMRR
jgi:hypothetical protein